MNRQSGILLHITSLPSRYGIGTLGKAAYEFVDFLATAGQSLWQVLPIGPTGYGNSPYQAFSTFAGNPWLIDLEELVEEGLLEREELLESARRATVDHVDFEMIEETRIPLLMKAAVRGVGHYGAEEQAFYTRNEYWLPDYALFSAIKAYFGGIPYWKWPVGLRDRLPDALAEYREMLSDQISCICFLQYLFERQWQSVKEYAARKGISLIGDLPIYVAADSADTWSHPDLFQLDENKRPILVAGVPPDAFSDDGQLWGNPLYNWEAMKATGYDWWCRRLLKAIERHQYVRIDHFRAFAAYYAIPGDSETAKVGEWVIGPGLDLFRHLGEKVPLDALIAEDLGILDDPVRELLASTKLPGMKVLLFGFSGEDSEYLCHNYVANSVAYIGTHDNEPLSGWLFNPKTPPHERKNAMEYMRLRESEGYHWGAISTLMACVSQKVIFQMQDILGLGNFARMNTPSTPSGNWLWRVRPDVLTEDLALRLQRITHTYHRC